MSDAEVPVAATAAAAAAAGGAAASGAEAVAAAADDGGSKGGEQGRDEPAGLLQSIANWFKRLFGGGGDKSPKGSDEAGEDADKAGSNGVRDLEAGEGVEELSPEAAGPEVAAYGPSAGGTLRLGRLLLPPLPHDPAAPGSASPDHLEPLSDNPLDRHRMRLLPSLRPPLLPPIGRQASGEKSTSSPLGPNIPTIAELAAGGRPRGLHLPPLHAGHEVGEISPSSDPSPRIPTLDEVAAGGMTKGIPLPGLKRRGLPSLGGEEGEEGTPHSPLLKPKLPGIRRLQAESGVLRLDDPEPSPMGKASSASAPPGIQATDSVIDKMAADEAVKEARGKRGLDDVLGDLSPRHPSQSEVRHPQQAAERKGGALTGLKCLSCFLSIF